MKESKFLSLNTRDLLRGLLMSTGTPVVGYVLESLNNGSWLVDWKHAAILGIAAGVTYLTKNFLTPKNTNENNS